MTICAELLVGNSAYVICCPRVLLLYLTSSTVSILASPGRSAKSFYSSNFGRFIIKKPMSHCRRPFTQHTIRLVFNAQELRHLDTAVHVLPCSSDAPTTKQNPACTKIDTTLSKLAQCLPWVVAPEGEKFKEATCHKCFATARQVPTLHKGFSCS